MTGEPSDTCGLVSTGLEVHWRVRQPSKLLKDSSNQPGAERAHRPGGSQTPSLISLCHIYLYVHIQVYLPYLELVRTSPSYI